LSFPECGLKKESNLSRRRREDKAFIYGGTNAGQKEHPWHAVLVIGSTVSCGGTLVSRTALVTGKDIFTLDLTLDAVIVLLKSKMLTYNFKNLNYFFFEHKNKI